MNILPKFKINSRSATHTGVRAKTIALMRFILATTGLIVYVLNPAVHTSHIEHDYDILTLYLAYAYCAYALLQCAFPSAMLKVVRPAWLHWVDVGWIVLLVSTSGALESPFFPFFFFAILIASFSFGFAEGVLVTTSCVLLSIITHYLPFPSDLPHPPFPSLVHAASLLILGYLIAHWGGLEILQKRQMELLGKINRLPNPQLSVEHVMGNILEYIREFYGAQSCLTVVRVPDDGYIIFKVENNPAKPKLLAQPIAEDLAVHLLAPPPEWYGVYMSDVRQYLSFFTSCLNIHRSNEAVTSSSAEFGEEVAQLLDADMFVSAPLRLYGMGLGRLYLTNCSYNSSFSDTNFLLQLVNQITPCIENVQLLDEIAVAATSTMRQQISLDLHDTTIQPYIGLKLGLEALSRKIPVGNAIAADVNELVHMTGEGIAELRYYIAGLKARLEEPLLPAIKNLAEKYRRKYGLKMAVNVEPDLQINDRLAAEIFHIVCEGLSNIHRHTNANRGSINLVCLTDQLIIQVINNSEVGQTFNPFTPRSISERAGRLGGTVLVSHHDGGTAVTIEIPL